jgi:PAS domain S-box-containing protein
MNILPVLHFFSFLLYVYVGVIVLLRNPKSPLHRVAFSLTCCCALWAFGMILLHNPQTPENLVELVIQINPIGWIGFAVFVLLFGFIFTEKEGIFKTKYFYFALFIIPILLLYQQWTHASIVADHIKQPYGVSHVWGKSIWTYIYWLYCLSYIGIGLYLVSEFWRKTDNPLKKKQSKIIVTSGAIAFFMGSSAAIVLPALHIYIVPQTVTLISLIWVIGAAYAMVKYNFLAVTPATAAEDIISTMAECLVLLGKNGNIITVNNATLHLLKYNQKDLQGSPADILFTEESLVTGLVHEIIGGPDFKNRDTHFKTKSGEHIPVSLSRSTLKDQAGETIGFVCVARDMTEDIKEQAEKKKLKTRLRQAQKMEALGIIAGGVAHDLNNVLGGIVGYPELLLMQIPEDSPLVSPMMTIQKSGEKAAAIVQDMLTLARRGVIVDEIVNLNKIITDYFNTPEQGKLSFFHPDVNFKISLMDNLPNITGSPVHLSKTVMNLISNAAEAMTEGGTVFISTKYQHIHGPLRGYNEVREGDYVTLTVSDTGVGICEEDMERIFEPFYTKKTMGRSGTGLGMAVVWETVKDHKGYIDVKSTVGKGTTFTLYFPITQKGLTKDKVIISSENCMGRGENILIVDDVEEQREIISYMLRKLGYSVTSIASGEEAVDFMKENSADLLVLDMIMDPGIDGLETYRRILQTRPHQKAIIASGFSATDRVREVQRLGAGTYLKKPFLTEEIGMAVRRELDRKENNSNQ